MTMKKDSKKSINLSSQDELRKEYQLSSLRNGVRGKYYPQAGSATNLVVIDPELSEIFPDSEAVNKALRVLAAAARTTLGRKRT